MMAPNDELLPGCATPPLSAPGPCLGVQLRLQVYRYTTIVIEGGLFFFAASFGIIPHIDVWVFCF